MKYRLLIYAVAFLLALPGCSSGTTDGSDGDADSGTSDGDADGYHPSDYDPGGWDPGTCTDVAGCPNPVQPNCGTTEICDDGIDNNCDGHVDENCLCNPGDAQRCFNGPPGKKGVGACEEGMQVCFVATDFGAWGLCEGGVAPANEVCDGVDNDCNGCVDEFLCCSGDLNCPQPGDPRIPEAEPFTEVVFHGSDFYQGPLRSFHWDVLGTPCDQLLSRTVNRTSYTISGEDSEEMHLFFRLSGDYQVTLTATDLAGGQHSCTFIVHVKGVGMRIELCWDTTGDVDLDLHLHRPGSTTNWYDPLDDCHWDNCTAEMGIDWGYPATDLDNCVGGPQGPQWAEVGMCRNPRLDIDSKGDVGIPENINVDNPRDGETFRVGVIYYRGSRPTHPVVNVYCGGRLTGSYGVYPDVVRTFSDMVDEPLWRVVDVTVHVAGQDFGNTACDVTPLRDPADPASYWVNRGNLSY